jgi:hypothetical protein
MSLATCNVPQHITNCQNQLPLDISKVFFLGLLQDKATAAFDMAELIKVIQGRSKARD